MKLRKSNWAAEKRRYEKKFIGLAGKPCRVLDIEKGQETEIGYTSSNNEIHIAYDHPIMDGLGDIEKASFREGVFAHEALHQIFTDFAAFERSQTFLKVFERPIFAMFVNVLEDASIENFAPEVMGGTLLKSLRFSIAHIYKKSPNIDKSQSAFSQLIAALINFGDLGLIKGKFTFPEARKIFFEIAPLFEQGIEEPVGKNRINIAKQIMDIAKPLWEQDAQNAEAMAKALEELSKRCKSSMNGKGQGKSADGSGSGSEDSLASKRRKITIKKVTKEELEEMKKNGEIEEAPSGGSGGSMPDGDITMVTCDEENGSENSSNSSGGMSIPGDSDGSSDTSGSSGKNSEDCDVEVEESEAYKKQKKEKSKKDKKGNNTDESKDGDVSDSSKSSKNGNKTGEKNSKSNSGKTEGDKDNTTDKTDKGADKADKAENDNKGNEPEKGNESEKRQNNSDSKNNPFVAPKSSGDYKIGNVPTPEGFEESEDENRIGEITSEEYSLTQEDVERIVEELERAEEEFKKEQQEENSVVPIDNFPITSPKLGKKSCLNYRVSYSDNDKAHLEESYGRVIAELGSGIKSLTTQLRRIFENDYEEREYRNSGKLNLKRYHSGRVTARVFDRKVSPTGKSNFSVEILVDESGSMSYKNKDKAARYCCIALSEVFANLNIPVYIIGFTADTQGHDIVHNHYITWKNTHNERLKLLNITARANNCDGYSVRYATEVIKKSKSENKLLIVLSDGQPAAHCYYDGVHDTKQAIKEAKKHSSVLGVAIGNSDTETIHYMYEKDFLNVTTVDDLFSGLARQLQKLMKNWGE